MTRFGFKSFLRHLHLKQNQKYYAFEHKQRFLYHLVLSAIISDRTIKQFRDLLLPQIISVREFFKPPPELTDCQGLTNKVPGNFLFILLTVAGTYGFSAESKRLLFSTLNHTSNGILHHFYGKSL
jgi:hypothetical protein